MLTEHHSIGFNYIKNPLLQWEYMPTFLVGEYLFYVLAIIALLHAKRNGSFHMLVWFGSFIAGTANDVFFMFLPVVDNFWQAQATIMLTSRLPLYIPCVYICFMYYSVIAAKQLPTPPIAAAALAGILALLFYGPYDIVGARFLWWTWHETDSSVRTRLLGVPVGSSIWIMTIVSSFYLLLHYSLKKSDLIRLKNILISLFIICLFTTPMMLVQMTLLQFLDKQRIPSITVFFFAISFYLFIIFIGYAYQYKYKGRLIFANGKQNIILIVATIVYFFTLSLIMIFGNPQKHISFGIHQTYGPCNVTGKDISGHTRKIFLCKEDTATNFTLYCSGNPPKEYDSWYTICGKENLSVSLLLGQLILCFLGLISYAFLYSSQNGVYQRIGKTR